MQPVPAYLFLTFLKIGATSWGGFMSLISMIQKKVVEKDRMLDNAKVMEGISLASVLPGPMAVNVVSYVGYQLGGWRGALISVTAVILPSFVLMLALSHFYFQYGDVPAMSHFFAGILPAVAAIIISVAISMGRKSISDIPQVLIAIVSAVAVFVSKSYFSTLAILLASALMGYLIYFKKSASTAAPESARPGFKIAYTLVMVAILLIGLITWPQSNPLAALHRTILLTFSGMSLTQFGGGYVIIPAMQKIIVDGHRWLSDRAFADAIAMGQVTPGPIFISATFIGYKLAGFWGALNATIAIFTPTAILTIIAARFFNKISQSELVVAVFKGLRPAIIGMIVSAGVSILWGNGFTLFSVAVFSAALGATIYFKTDPAIVVPVAGILGLLILQAMAFTPVQIIGTQRSGSNLLRLMLNQLPEVSAPHPPHILERIMPLLPVYGDLTIESQFDQLIDDVCTLVETNPVPWTAVTLDRAAIRVRCEAPTLPEIAKAVYELKAQADGARIWTCKSMANIHYAAELEQYSTPPRYIHLFRDGRDVALSFKKAIVGEKHAYHLAQQWKREQEASIALYEKLGPGRVLRVRYEDLLKDPETELRSICTFIGAQYSETALAYHESAESRETANSGLMWQNVVKPVLTNNHRKFLAGLPEADIRIFERVAGYTLEKLGYELVYKKDDTLFSAEEISDFSQINQDLKKEFRSKLRPEDLEKRRAQEQLLKAIADRLPLIPH